MEGARIRAAQDAQLQATLGGVADRYAAKKQREADRAAAGLDIDKLAPQVLVKMKMGQELNPQETAILQAWDAINTTKVAQDPITGNYRKVNASIFDGMPSTATPRFVPESSSNVPMAQPEFLPPVSDGFNIGALQVPSGVIPAPNKNAAALDFTGLPQPAPMQNQGGRLNIDMLGPVPAQPVNAPVKLQAPVVPGNLAATQKGLEAATQGMVDLQKRSAEADISASEAGATKRAQMTQENQVNQEAKVKGLKELNSSIDKLIESAKGTPSGVLQGTAATISSLAGKPNKQALARAKFESGKALSSLQSRIAFLKGQGTITDSEAATAMAFIPESNDPYEIKLQKLNSAKEYIKLLTGEGEQAPSGPGFKYLGVKK